MSLPNPLKRCQTLGTAKEIGCRLDKLHAHLLEPCDRLPRFVDYRPHQGSVSPPMAVFHELLEPFVAGDLHVSPALHVALDRVGALDEVGGAARVGLLLHDNRPAPVLDDAKAAAIPEPPAPTMTTSVSSTRISPLVMRSPFVSLLLHRIAWRSCPAILFNVLLHPSAPCPRPHGPRQRSMRLRRP